MDDSEGLTDEENRLSTSENVRFFRFNFSFNNVLKQVYLSNFVEFFIENYSFDTLKIIFLFDTKAI